MRLGQRTRRSTLYVARAEKMQLFSAKILPASEQFSRNSRLAEYDQFLRKAVKILQTHGRVNRKIAGSGKMPQQQTKLGSFSEM
jgi:hypothetical protein